MQLQLDLQTGDDGGAAGAQAVLVSGQGVHPAAGALLALGFADTDGQVGEVGAGRRTRTPDLLITNQLLYRLSYTGNSNRTCIL